MRSGKREIDPPLWLGTQRSTIELHPPRAEN